MAGSVVCFCNRLSSLLWWFLYLARLQLWRFLWLLRFHHPRGRWHLLLARPSGTAPVDLLDPSSCCSSSHPRSVYWGFLVLFPDLSPVRRLSAHRGPVSQPFPVPDPSPIWRSSARTGPVSQPFPDPSPVRRSYQYAGPACQRFPFLYLGPSPVRGAVDPSASCFTLVYRPVHNRSRSRAPSFTCSSSRDRSSAARV